VSESRNKINNEVLKRLWNDPQVRELRDAVKAIHPNWELSDNEVVVDYDHLIEPGFQGEPPYFHIRFGKWMIYARPVIYEDYWMKLKLPRGREKSLYSIFREGH
jgi:hypothetical protein